MAYNRKQYVNGTSPAINGPNLSDTENAIATLADYAQITSGTATDIVVTTFNDDMSVLKVEITSKISGAAITINRNSEGAKSLYEDLALTSEVIALDPGTYEFVRTGTGYYVSNYINSLKQATRYIQPTSGTATAITIEPLTNDPVILLEIPNEISGAPITVNRNAQGAKNLYLDYDFTEQAEDLQPGRYQIVEDTTGYQLIGGVSVFDTTEFKKINDGGAYVVSVFNTYEEVFSITGKGYIAICNMWTGGGDAGKLKITVDGGTPFNAGIASGGADKLIGINKPGYTHDTGECLAYVSGSFGSRGFTGTPFRDQDFNDDTQLGMVMNDGYIKFDSSLSVEISSPGNQPNNWAFIGGVKV